MVQLGPGLVTLRSHMGLPRETTQDVDPSLPEQRMLALEVLSLRLGIHFFIFHNYEAPTHGATFAVDS